MYKKILIGVDGSEEALRAVERVRQIEEDWPRDVVIFHSIEDHILETIPAISIAAGGPYYAGMGSLEIEQNKIKRGKEILKKAKKILHFSMANIETRLIKNEKPEKYIKDVVEKEGFDLVVLGYKGEHSKLKEILLGSVALNVLHHTPCDVLIVR